MLAKKNSQNVPNNSLFLKTLSFFMSSRKIVKVKMEMTYDNQLLLISNHKLILSPIYLDSHITGKQIFSALKRHWL